MHLAAESGKRNIWVQACGLCGYRAKAAEPFRKRRNGRYRRSV